MNTMMIRPVPLTRHWPLALAATIVGLAIPEAQAVPVNLTDPTPHYTAKEMPAPPHPEAGVVAHLWNDSITLASSLYFQDAWNAWNAAQPVGMTWTLNTSSFLIPDALTINVTQFDAQSFHGAGHVGGVEINIEWSYGGPEPVDDLRWSQGLYDNYTLGPGGGIVPPFYEMDVSTDPNHWPPPLYPFQYVDQSFYDFPKAPYETGFFEADAFLSKADFTNRTLTLYDGVHYGFYLYATPEPASWVLLLTGLVIAAIAGNRKRRAGLRSA